MSGCIKETVAFLVLIVLLSYAEIIDSFPFRQSSQYPIESEFDFLTHIQEEQQQLQSDLEHVYRRFSRRRPSEYAGDLYVDDVHEVFKMDTPPKEFSLGDEEINKMLLCDLDPSQEQCKGLVRVPNPEELDSPDYDFGSYNPFSQSPFYLDDDEVLRLVLCDFYPTADCRRRPSYRKRTETTTRAASSTTERSTTTAASGTKRPPSLRTSSELEEFPFLPEIPEETTEAITEDIDDRTPGDNESDAATESTLIENYDEDLEDVTGNEGGDGEKREENEIFEITDAVAEENNEEPLLPNLNFESEEHKEETMGGVPDADEDYTDNNFEETTSEPPVVVAGDIEENNDIPIYDYE